MTSFFLTAPHGFGNLWLSITMWGFSVPRGIHEKGGFSLWRTHAPEMCLPARAAVAHIAMDSLRRFFASEIQNYVRYIMSKHTTLVDMLDVCHSKLSFLSDAISQDKVETFRLSPQGNYGLYNIISEIETELEFVMNEMTTPEVK